MDNKEDTYYIDKIKSDLEFIIQNMNRVDIQELNDNELLLDSMLFRMIQISENSKRLSSEFKKSKRNVPWEAMLGLRNRVVHDYGNVDLQIVFDTLKYDIPAVLEALNE